jgi:hypothetical protein
MTTKPKTRMPIVQAIARHKAAQAPIDAFRDDPDGYPEHGMSSPVARSGNRLVRMQRNPSRMPRDSLVRRRGGRWRGWRPSIFSLNFDSTLGITVHGGAKIRWRSPTAILLSREQDAADMARVQGERQGSLPTLRQLP